MSRIWIVAAMALVVGLGSGCSQQKPAQAAIDTAENALAAVNEQAQKYIPDKYAAVKAELDKARKDFEDGKYAEAIKVAGELPARAKALGEEAAAAKQKLAGELAPEWQQLADSVPGRIDALDAWIKQLTGASRLPPGVERKAVDNAGSELGLAQKAWSQAQDEFGKGNIEPAVARAKAVDLLVTKIGEKLGMAPTVSDKTAG